jgi:hypothetical protein
MTLTQYCLRIRLMVKCFLVKVSHLNRVKKKTLKSESTKLKIPAIKQFFTDFGK